MGVLLDLGQVRNEIPLESVHTLQALLDSLQVHVNEVLAEDGLAVVDGRLWSFTFHN